MAPNSADDAKACVTGKSRCLVSCMFFFICFLAGACLLRTTWNSPKEKEIERARTSLVYTGYLADPSFEVPGLTRTA